MRVASLGSGSSGNALLVQTGRTAVLVDAGLGPRTLVSRLRQVGVTPRMLSAILLTHEHSDHACGAAAFAARHGIPLLSEPRTLAAVLDQAAQRAQRTLPAMETAAECEGETSETRVAVERMELRLGDSTKLHDLEIRSFAVSHDAVAPSGFVLATGAWRVCVAIDTGEVVAPMLEAMRGASLLVIEANHEKQRLLAGPYPWSLKRRILGATGHLSNEQTSQALVSVLDENPAWVWLAHLSRTNNTPDLARAQVRDALLRAGLRHVPVQAAPPGVGPVWDSATLWGAATVGVAAVGASVTQPVAIRADAGGA